MSHEKGVETLLTKLSARDMYEMPCLCLKWFSHDSFNRVTDRYATCHEGVVRCSGARLWPRPREVVRAKISPVSGHGYLAKNR